MNIPPDLETLFHPDTAGDAVRTLRDEAATNTHIAWLASSLPFMITRAELQQIVDYGISRLSNEKNPELASFFFVLSCLKGQSPTTRDFFIDVMTYCEDDIGSFKSVEAILATYDLTIRHAL